MKLTSLFGIIIAIVMACIVDIAWNNHAEPAVDVAFTATAIKTSEETQYLAFFIPADGLYEASTPEATFNDIDKKAKAIVDRIGIIGSATHRLAFAIVLAPWLFDQADPSHLQMIIEQAFKVAKSRNIAVYFSVMTHYLWPTRLICGTSSIPQLPVLV